MGTGKVFLIAVLATVLVLTIIFVLALTVLPTYKIVSSVYEFNQAVKQADNTSVMRSTIKGNFDSQVAKDNNMVYFDLYNMQGFIQETQWIFLINGQQYLPGYYPFLENLVVITLVNEKNHQEVAGMVNIAEYLQAGDLVSSSYSFYEQEIVDINRFRDGQTLAIEMDLKEVLQRSEENFLFNTSSQEF